MRRELEDFNARVIKARYTPVDGPPLITQPRDVEAEVAAWRERRAARHAVRRAEPAPGARRSKPRPPSAGSGVECVIPRGSRPLLRSAHA